MTADSRVHFRILDDIARDLTGDVNFPTCLDAAVLVSNALKDPFASIEQVTKAIGVEPLISSKLLRLANSVAYNPGGESVASVNSAIRRLGFEIVRTTSLAVAMDQMLQSKNLAVYQHIARPTWENSLHVAAIARVLARQLGRVAPEKAMLSGLVHNIGAFYLLFRAADYDDYRNNESALFELLSGWQDEIGENLLLALGMPAEITDAVRSQHRLSDHEIPCTLSDMLYFATLLARAEPPWEAASADTADVVRREEARTAYADLLKSAEDEIATLRVALSG